MTRTAGRTNPKALVLLRLALVVVLTAAICSVMSGLAMAAPGDLTDGDYAYAIGLDGGAQITGYSGPGGDITIPGTLGGLPVTSIAAGAFYGTNLTSVVIPPDTVASIGGDLSNGGAFMNCALLTSVTIPDSVVVVGQRAFLGCSALTSITIPDGVTTIEPETFYGCTSLDDVTIGSGVTTIGDPSFSYGGSWYGAFEGCTSLASVSIPDSVTYIGTGAFKDCMGLTTVSIGSGVRAIGGRSYYDWLTYRHRAGAFSGCAQLDNVSFPEGLTSIGDCAFSDCSSLSGAAIPDSVTTIGFEAFISCPSLDDLVFLGDHLTSIGDYAFAYSGQQPLQEDLYLPDSLTSIGLCAFSGYGVTAFRVGSGNDKYYTGQDGVLCSKDGKTLIQCPAKKTGVYSIRGESTPGGPEAVTLIDAYAFERCELLTEVVIPASVRFIAEHAFSYCTSITRITIPDSVFAIGTQAFNACSSLDEVTIEPGLTSIGTQAFIYCTSLEEITLPQTLESLGASAFAQDNNLDTITFEAENTEIIQCDNYSYPYWTTIPASVTIVGSEGSTANQYAATYGNQFQALVIPDSDYYVLLLNDSTATLAGVLGWVNFGHVALLFYATDQTDTGLDNYFSFGSGPDLSAESVFFEGEARPRPTYKTYLTEKGVFDQSYDRFLVFRLSGRQLYTEMIQKARDIAFPPDSWWSPNAYFAPVKDCLTKACEVLSMAESYFALLPLNAIPNNAFSDAVFEYGLEYGKTYVPTGPPLTDANFGTLVAANAIPAGGSVPRLESIAITSLPSKLEYGLGDSLDVSGLVVTGTYSDTTTRILPVTVSDVTGFDASVPAEIQILTITLGAQTATYEISVGSPLSPTIAVITPDTAGPFAQADTVTVNWTASNISDGYFHIYAFDGEYHYLASTSATGAASYSYDWTVSQPTGSGYVIRIWYMDETGNWLLCDNSEPTFEISGSTLPAPTVTLPDSAGPFAQGSTVPVAWDVASPSSEGVFHIYAFGSDTYYYLGSEAADGSPSYTYDWKISQPAGTGYVIRIWYVDELGNWLCYDDSSPAFEIGEGSVITPTVTLPSTGDPVSQGDVVPVAWSVADSPTGGYYHVYAFGSDTYYYLGSEAADGSPSYTYSWTVSQPTGEGYVIRVWYVDAEGNWLCYDDSSPAFDISGSILPTLSVTTPDSAGPFAQAEAVTVNWTASNISDGYFHIYAYDGDYHYLASTVATGAASYIYDWTVSEPTGSGYVIRIWYVDTNGNWLLYDDSEPAFEIE